MGLYYQTEYRLGSRGGTVRRSYTGLGAFLAITLDLFFVLTFELVVGLVYFVIKNMKKIVILILRAVFYVLSLPFRVAHWISLKLESRSRLDSSGPTIGRPLKPAWAGRDEV
jgi:hypothetical protein